MSKQSSKIVLPPLPKTVLQLLNPTVLPLLSSQSNSILSSLSVYILFDVTQFDSPDNINNLNLALKGVYSSEKKALEAFATFIVEKDETQRKAFFNEFGNILLNVDVKKILEDYGWKIKVEKLSL